MVLDAFAPFAKDTQRLTGGVSLWLDTPKADFLRGGFLSVNCESPEGIECSDDLGPCLTQLKGDVDEMTLHNSEIKDQELNQLGFLNAKLGPEGHPWGGSLDSK